MEGSGTLQERIARSASSQAGGPGVKALEVAFLKGTRIAFNDCHTVSSMVWGH